MKKLSLIAFLTLFAFAPNAFERVENFGENPGGLVMYKFVPKTAQNNAPMLVLMHGCMQEAKSFAVETGWQKLADDLGVLLLLPEQTKSNNGMRCFTWFEKGDVTRGNGEIASIANMMSYMETTHKVDKSRVFVAGLSAGATMASALMASYPDRINSGAIVSGVYFGCAFQLYQSFTCMIAPSNLPSETRGEFVREASNDYTGSFPHVTIMHGSIDPFVNPVNADYSVDQWTNVHGLDGRADNTRPVINNQTIEEHSKDGKVLVSKLVIIGAGHGWPINSSADCGKPSPVVINTGICAAKILAKTWGLTD